MHLTSLDVVVYDERNLSHMQNIHIACGTLYMIYTRVRRISHSHGDSLFLCSKEFQDLLFGSSSFQSSTLQKTHMIND